jgi:peptidylprolyl isomerase
LPPNYTACIKAQQAAAGNTPASQSVREVAAEKATCETNYRTLVTEVLNYLIPRMWAQGEAASLNIHVTPAQIEQAYQQELKASRPPLTTPKERRRFLAATGETVADQKWLTMVNLLVNKIPEQQGVDLTAKWQPRTQCRPGYTVPTYCATTPPRLVPQPSWVPTTMSIIPPPSRPQTLPFIPTAKKPPPTSPKIVTPGTGPLSTEPTIAVPNGPPPTTLIIKDLIAGTGAVARAGEKLTVNYVGALYGNGKIFDASWNRHQTFPFTLGVGEVIPGWDRGVAGMRVGGRRELIIPPGLAYGKTGSGNAIPPNATLIFVVDLLAIRTPGGSTGATGATYAPGALG